MESNENNQEPNANNQENNEHPDPSNHQESFREAPQNQENMNSLENVNENDNPNSSNQAFEPEDLLGSINNNIFLSENTLESLYLILFSKGSYLDEVCLKEEKLEEKFSSVLLARKQSLFSILGDKMQFYHSKLIDGELSHLEKLMKVLRSKKREMRLKKIEPEEGKIEEEREEEINFIRMDNEKKEDFQDHKLDASKEDNTTAKEVNSRIEPTEETKMDNEKKEDFQDHKLNASKEDNITEKEEINNRTEPTEETKEATEENNTQNKNDKTEEIEPEKIVEKEVNNFEAYKNEKDQEKINSDSNFLHRPRSNSTSPHQSFPVARQRSASCIDFHYFCEKPPMRAQNPRNIFTNDIHNLLSFKDLSDLTSLNIFKKKLMREYNPVDNSFSFKLNNRYLVTLRSFEEKVIDQTSLFHKIPYSVMQNYIFPCFSAYGLFYLRQVSSEWRELIRSMWHKTFQREMHEQLYAADLCQEIECNFKLISLRTPFVHKFAIFLKALAEILDWDWVQNLGVLENENVDLRIKMILYSIFKILGNRPLADLQNLNEMTDEVWETMKPSLQDGSLRSDMNNVIDSEYHFNSNAELVKLREKFVNAYAISISSIGDVDNKNNVIILSIYLKQLFLFALLKNSVFIGQKFLYYVKDVLKKISDSWPQKKGFLEGAYKILLFKNVRFVNGHIVVTDEDEFNNNGNEEENKEDEGDSNNNFMNLMSTFRDPDKPDFVIKKRGTEIRIYLDDSTKAELILSSILSFSSRSLGKLLHLAKETKEKINTINQELKREEMLKQEKKRLELMIEAKNQEETLDKEDKQII